MDSKKILPGSSDLLTAVQAESFIKRLDILWPHLDKKVNFLRIIVATASTNQADLMTLTHKFVGDVLKSKLINTLVDEYICPMPYDPNMQKPLNIQLADYLVKLLLLGFALNPSNMDIHLPKVENVISCLLKIKHILAEDTVQQIERLDISLKDRHETRAAQRLQKSQPKKREYKDFEGSAGEPPMNFRDLSVVPVPEDVGYNYRPYLRAAKKKGKYDSDEHYLDVQFRLLREDLIRPLREGIAAYQKGGTKQTDLYVYTDVELGASTMHQQTGELISYASLKGNRRIRFDKRLKYGSLALKPGDAVPFSNYLVSVNTDTQIPAYMEGKTMDFKDLIKDNFKQYFETTHFRVDQIHERLNPEVCGMDQSQFDALVYALTTNLAIIQGPPGTGKTYMGLQLAKLLFENWDAWNSEDDKRPMLVVCYTNHALDQFLEGISRFLEDGIIRVGGRCKNPALEQFMLSKKRQWDNPTLRTQFFHLRREISQLQTNIEEKSACLKELEKRFANPGLLLPVITNSETPYYFHSKNLYKPFKNETLMFKWLTQTYNDRTINPNDIGIIQQLIEWGVSEIKAKNALFRAYQNNENLDAFGLFGKLKNPPYRNLPDNRLFREAERQWPTMNDINEVLKLGYNEIVAVELLAKSNVIRIRQEHNRARTANPDQEFANVIIPEAAAPPPPSTEEDEEMDITDYKNDEDDNRMLVDTNILDEGFVKQEPKKDATKKSSNWFNSEILPYFIEFITVAPAMTEEEANVIEDIWELPLQSRWRLYQYWIEKVRNSVNDEMKALEDKYSEHVKRLTEIRSLADVSILKSAKVVGMTTTGAAKHQSTLRSLRPRILIVEEAAEVLEAHLVASLTEACQHLILIGDHKQLRPNPAVYELAIKYNLEISLFERLINNQYPYRMLENQHRMCPIISRTLMPHFYKNLRDDPSVYDRDPVKGVTKNLMFITHTKSEVLEREFKSHRNPYEAEYAICLARYFLQQTYMGDDITVLCTYLDQLSTLRKTADKILGRGHGLNIQSVDNYQGEESNIIILSLISNRVCVALSRAKMGLYVLCNLDFLAQNHELWKKIKESAADVEAVSTELIVKCQMHGKEQVIKAPKDFEIKCREGGCDVACNFRLDCGHQCVKPCHNDDMNHEKYKCQKPCQKKCEAGHACKKDCWQDCGQCKIKVVKNLLCGHQKNDFCYLKPDEIKCVEPCNKFLDCGHPCKNECGAKCTNFCKEMVTRQIPNCQHIVEIHCSANVNVVKCDASVKKEWPLCKHVFEAKCSDDVSKIPCKQPCNTSLPDCGHKCKGTCGECRNGRIHIKCTENCKKILICGHECEEKCSKVCPPCTKSCETACGHSQCGKLSIKGENIKKLRIVGKAKQAPGRKCGEPCPPCMEKCLNQCEHRQCDLRCGDPCTVLPCSEPCQKLLPCDPSIKNGKNVEDEDYVPHFCIGVCGDDCPKICKICKPEKFAEIKETFLGYEEEENARFVQLKDCKGKHKCIVEVRGLDQWIESLLPNSEDSEAATEIVKINCPKCKTPICRSKRYISLLNQRALDIENIKQIIRGLNPKEKKIEQEKFSKNIKTCFNIFSEIGKVGEVTWLLKILKKPNENLITKSWFTTSRNILNIIKLLTKYEARAVENIKPMNIEIKNIQNKPIFKQIMSEQKITNFWEDLKKELIYLIGRIDPRNISETTVQQIAYETQRFGFLVEVCKKF
uniref:NFX1-type zinc finger-containing protein 1 n=1 Tax=Panagrolaimus davidi TaxID=227884 RepID=A0A914QGV9_9BILA